MNIPRVERVKPQKNHILLVSFTNGVNKKYDISHLLNKDLFAPLKNPAFFNNIHVEPGGFTIAWDSEIDISEFELWQHGKECC